MNHLSNYTTKPYLLKSELAFLYDKTANSLNTTIARQLHSGKLLSLKNGMYTTAEFAQSAGEAGTEYLANALYYPSYLSLEYVLSRAQVIPEGVYAYTSITTRPTRRFQTKLGTFSYRSIKPTLFTGFRRHSYQQQYQIKTASTAKALFDWLYLKPFPLTMAGKRRELLDLRLNWEVVTDADLTEFLTYATLAQSKKMVQLLRCLQQERNNAH